MLIYYINCFYLIPTTVNIKKGAWKNKNLGLEPSCCKKWQKKKQVLGIGDILNDTKSDLDEHEWPPCNQNHLWSIWFHSEPSDLPYSPNQFLGWDFLAISYSKMALVFWECGICLEYLAKKNGSGLLQVSTPLRAQWYTKGQNFWPKAKVFSIWPRKVKFQIYDSLLTL